MTSAHAQDPYDELDALVREAMSPNPEKELDEPAREPFSATGPDPFADYDGKVVNLLERMSAAALQGYGRKRH